MSESPATPTTPSEHIHIETSSPKDEEATSQPTLPASALIPVRGAAIPVLPQHGKVSSLLSNKLYPNNQTCVALAA